MRSIRAFHFVTGRNISTTSTTWWASLWSLLGRGLAGDGDDRRSVEVGVGDAGQQVGGAGPERRHGDGRATREPAVDIGHERGALLVAGGDVADRLGPREGLEDVHRLLAGHGEHVLAVLCLEAVDEQVGSGPGLG